MIGGRIRDFAKDNRRAGVVGFVWGLAEGLAFFIVPDVYITFATLFSVRAGIVAWVASIAGSAVAVALLYGLVALLQVDYLPFLKLIPGVSDGLLQRVGGSLAGDGLPYTPLLVLTGVPLKVYAGLAIARGVGLGPLLLWTLFARVVRIAPGVAGFAAARALWGRRIDAHPDAWCAALGLAWLLFYTAYFVAMGRL